MPFTASDICKISALCIRLSELTWAVLAIRASHYRLQELIWTVLPPLGVFLERGCNADLYVEALSTVS